MELSNSDYDSEWLKEMTAKVNNPINSNISEEGKKIKSWANEYGYSCCKNPKIGISNDGGKTQKCFNCGWSKTFH